MSVVLPLSVLLAVTDPVPLGVPEPVGVPLGVPVGLPLGVRVALALPEGESEPVAEADAPVVSGRGRGAGAASALCQRLALGQGLGWHFQQHGLSHSVWQQRAHPSVAEIKVINACTRTYALSLLPTRKSRTHAALKV